MKLELTTEVTTEPTICPKLQAQLRRELIAYARLKRELKEMEDAVEELAAHIETVRAETGEKSVGIEGYGRVTLVDSGVTEKLDRRKLLANGVKLSVIEMSTVCVPRKAFTKITLLGNKKEQHGDE